MTKVLRQILNSDGVVVQVQEDDMTDSDIAASQDVVAIQNAPTPAPTVPLSSPPVTTDQPVTPPPPPDNPPS